MIRRDGSRMLVSGPVTLASVASQLEQGCSLIRDGVGAIDLGEVAELDSSALALLLAWLREAQLHERQLVFTNLPEGLNAIARLYGVAELLPGAEAQAQRHH